MNTENPKTIESDESRKETSKLCIEIGFPAYHLMFFVEHTKETQKQSPQLTPRENIKMVGK